MNPQYNMIQYYIDTQYNMNSQNILNNLCNMNNRTEYYYENNSTTILLT